MAHRAGRWPPGSADRDRSRFTGRGELAFLERCLDDADPPASVVLITGPGGIGKSTLLREAARGRRPRHQRRRHRRPGAWPGPRDAGSRAARRRAARPAPLVLLDSYERMTALSGYLRRGCCPACPTRPWSSSPAGPPRIRPGSRAAGSGRARRAGPGRAGRGRARRWAAYGIDDDAVQRTSCWAAGSPLALSLAADAAAGRRRLERGHRRPTGPTSSSRCSTGWSRPN